MVDLVMNITFPINEPEKFKVEGNVRPERQADLIREFLRGQIGQGSDPAEPNFLDVYHVRIEIDLSDDSFRVSSDTGSKGLRDGILMDVAERLPKST